MRKITFHKCIRVASLCLPVFNVWLFDICTQRDHSSSLNKEKDNYPKMYLTSNCQRQKQLLPRKTIFFLSFQKRPPTLIFFFVYSPPCLYCNLMGVWWTQNNDFPVEQKKNAQLCFQAVHHGSWQQLWFWVVAHIFDNVCVCCICMLICILVSKSGEFIKMVVFFGRTSLLIFKNGSQSRRHQAHISVGKKDRFQRN